MAELVSVIVPVYNAESVLPKTLSCIADQTYRNLEIILVDDGSTDSSGAICDRFAETDGRCKVIHKANGGQGSAKNAGLTIASGEFLFFPDSDDIFSRDMVRILYEAVSKDPEYDLAISGMEMVSGRDTGTISPDDSDAAVQTVVYSKDELVQGLFRKHDDRFVFGWNKLYRRKLLEGLRSGDYPRHQDFDFNLRVFLRAEKAVYVDRNLYHWVQWSGSKTHQPDTWDLYYECRTAILSDNLESLSGENRRFDHLLLDALYRAMVFWEERSRKSGRFKAVRTKCRNYTKATLWRYIRCRRIRVGKKIVCILLLSFPSFAHFVMKVTKNAW